MNGEFSDLETLETLLNVAYAAKAVDAAFEYTALDVFLLRNAVKAARAVGDANLRGMEDLLLDAILSTEVVDAAFSVRELGAQRRKIRKWKGSSIRTPERIEAERLFENARRVVEGHADRMAREEG